MRTQIEFYDTGIGLVPLPDETLFSWCSRYHRVAVNGKDRNTSIQLFGDARAGLAHDFPARLSTFTTHSRGALGTSSQIIQRMTLLPFYLPFKSTKLAGIAERALLEDGIQHLKYHLGLLTSGLGANHPLKACPSCVERDLQTSGWAHWRRNHQLPGVWLCSEHRMALTIYSQRTKQLFRSNWILPSTEKSASTNYFEDLKGSSLVSKWLLKLSALSIELLSYKAGSFADPSRIGSAFRSRLAALGVACSSGRLRWPLAMPYFKSLIPSLLRLPGLNHEANIELLQSQLQRLMSGRASSHPLRYLVWISVWFDSLSDFRCEYERTDATILVDDFEQVVSGQPDAAESYEYAELFAAVGRGEISMTAAAQKMGISYATAAARACKMQITAPRRPKKLVACRWDLAVSMLQAGASKAEVADACKASITTVTRILRTVPGLQHQWHDFQHGQRRTVARHAWTEIAKLKPYLGIGGLRCLEPAAYAWLYRNDREWLKGSYDNITRAAGSNNSSRRIENADIRMATALTVLAAKWTPTSRDRTLAEISKAIPGVRKAVEFPERWPMTIRALSEVLRYHGNSGSGELLC